MKKIILGLFIFINSLIFGWSNFENYDDEIIAVETFYESGSMKISKTTIEEFGTNIYIMQMFVSKYLGPVAEELNEENVILVMFKIDNNPAIIQGGFIVGKSDTIETWFNADSKKEMKILNQMKAGNILRIAIGKRDGEVIVRTINLKGFTKAINKITSKKIKSNTFNLEKNIISSGNKIGKFIIKNNVYPIIEIVQNMPLTKDLYPTYFSFKDREYMIVGLPEDGKITFGKDKNDRKIVENIITSIKQNNNLRLKIEAGTERIFFLDGTVSLKDF